MSGETITEDEPAGGMAAAGVRDLFGICSGARLLTVGDGNLSFSLALLRSGTEVDGLKITATIFENEDQVKLSQSNADRIFAHARELQDGGVTVEFGIDAADLEGTLPAKSRDFYDGIIFQFPQHPQRRKIQMQRGLIRSFLSNAARMLNPKGCVAITLCQGQGGTPAEFQARKNTDTWQVQNAAAECGLLLTRVAACPMDELQIQGYECTGFRPQGLRSSNANKQQSKQFCTEGALVHIFTKESVSSPRVFSAFPLVWSHDVSFWTPEVFEEEDLRTALINSCCDPSCTAESCEVFLKLVDEYVSPEGKKSRTYRLSCRTSHHAMSQMHWRRLCNGTCELISAAITQDGVHA